jgi:hypothetical protein
MKTGPAKPLDNKKPPRPHWSKRHEPAPLPWESRATTLRGAIPLADCLETLSAQPKNRKRLTAMPLRRMSPSNQTACVAARADNKSSLALGKKDAVRFANQKESGLAIKPNVPH